ncbi:phosphoglycerate mutase family protein [Propioniciclava soli]|uniref:Phosphoglycerate mutase family protein n=1 Tax=Propioniciclava soli TaxID=2775081 RepID=A0ABZ3C818_9ACTN
MRWILVRHGQSTWNVEGRVQGQAPGVGLTELGRQQAADAGAAVAAVLGPEVDGAVVRVLTSDLERAAATAAVVADAVGAPVAADPDLREQDAGTLTGRLTRELTALPTPPDSHVHAVRWGGGESIADVWERVARFVGRTPPSAAVVVVSHGATLQVLRAVLGGRSGAEVSWRDVTWHDALPTGGVLVVDVPET